jgi:energy-coupling factor transporter transmembrane protein EcfT
MRLDFLDRASAHDSPIHRLDPRIMLIGAVTYVVAVVLTPIGQWPIRATDGSIVASAKVNVTPNRARIFVHSLYVPP